MTNGKQSRGEPQYFIFWWLDQTPYVAHFKDETEADSAARVRNALFLEIREDGAVGRILDYYRRDEDGNPMPAVWRELSRGYRGRGQMVLRIPV
ncbi:MAG: hypothetical protein V3U17_02595 [Thermoplasmata archaeon]